MADTPVETHAFQFGSENGGEALTLTTKFFGEDGDIYINQELTLNSYGNSATFNLCGSPMTPAELRRLAFELDRINIKLGAI